MEIKNLSKRTLKRLPYYLDYLMSAEVDENGYVSSSAIAEKLDLNEVQVRKDLAACNCRGLPKKGFKVSDAVLNLRDCLGHGSDTNAVLIGAGNLGKALLSYRGFEQYGFNIVAAFDSSPEAVDGLRVLNMDEFSNIVKHYDVKIAIITVPAQFAQSVCDTVIENGIRAIWNFAPAHLNVPKGVLVQNESMASSLAVLSNHLKAQSR